MSTSPTRVLRRVACALVALTLAIVLTPPASAAPADAVTLKAGRDAPSQTYVEFETEVEQKMAGPDGKPMEISTRSVYGLMQSAKRDGDGIALELTLDRLLGYMSFGESMKSLYDTDDPDYDDASPMHKDTFGPILGMAVRVKLGADGTATGVDGGEAIRQKLREMGQANFVAMSLAGGDLIDRRIMSEFAEAPLVLLPNREVKAGDAWKKSQVDEFQHVGKVLLDFDCTLERVEKAAGRQIAVVAYKGTVRKDPDEKPAEGKRLGKIDATFSGTARFDAQTSRLLEMSRQTEAKVEVPPWFSRDADAPLMKIDLQSKLACTTRDAADRKKQKAQIAERIAAAKAKRDAEAAAAMAGPVEPPTPENEPVPWMQWGGPNRDFCSNATGLANRWPEGGPARLWERPLGDGFSAIVCDGDSLYTTYSLRDKEDAFKGEEVVVALDARTGKTRWEHKYPAPWPKDLQMEFGPGPHSTPLVVGNRLFTIGCTAKLHCLDTKTGSVVWAKDLHEEFKAALLERGYGASPLAYGGNIVLPVSKEKGHAVMAFKQSDGTVAWKGGTFDPGYASLLAIDVGGVEQLVAFSGKAVLGIDPADGSEQWSVEHPTQWGANISTPVWNGEDQHLFISSAYGMGSRGVKLEKAGSRVTAKEAWFNPKMKIQHATAARVGKWVYGSSGDFGPAFLCCLDARTGEMAWQQRGIAKANVVYADGKLIVLDEEGSLYLVKADPKKYRLLGKVEGLCKKTAWTVPTLVGRTLYLRDREKILALDLGAAKRSGA